MGIPVVKFAEADWSPAQLWLIDLRLVGEEYARLEKVIRAHPQTTFLLRIVDPYWETCLQAINTRFIFQHALDSNVGIVSGYQPEEACQLLQDVCNATKKLFVCPNPYDKRKELPIDETWLLRKKTIGLAGAAGPSLYPYRTFLRRKRVLDPWLWGRVTVLSHPGYADIGDRSPCKVSGDSFIAWMAQFRFFYLCPGRCRLEFVKYRECAYAGCVPIGVPPKTMTPQTSKHMLPLDWTDYENQRNRILKIKKTDAMERAKNFRQAFAKDRDPQSLRERLVSEVLSWRS